MDWSVWWIKETSEEMLIQDKSRARGSIKLSNRYHLRTRQYINCGGGKIINHNIDSKALRFYDRYLVKRRRW